MLVRILAIALVIGCGSMQRADAQQQDLRWKFQSGEKLQYVVQQNFVTTMKIRGETQEVKSNNRLDMTWVVETLDASGKAIIVQTIDRVVMKMEGGPQGSTTFDTASSDAPKTPSARLMSSVFRRIVGQGFRVTMLTDGTVSDVQIPKGLMAAIVETQGGDPNAAPVVTEDMLKQMMEQSAVSLPGGSTEIGHSWTTAQTVEMPLAQMSVMSLLTLTGSDPSTREAMITIKPSISVTPRKDAPVQLKLLKADGNGLMRFDATRGRITRSELKLVMDMEVSQFGEVITQTTEQQTVMQLTQPPR